MAPSTADLRAVPGLHDLWASTTQCAAPADDPLPAGTLLAILGLGVEQTLTHLGRERPAWDDFVTWIVRTAGPPVPRQVERWTAWAEGRPVPPAEVERQAAVMASAPVLDAAEMATWDRDGVVVLRGAVTGAEAGAIADHLAAVIGVDLDDPSTWTSGGARQGIMVQEFQHPAMDVPRRSARVAKAFAQLHGHADLVASVDRLGFNPPERPAAPFTGPHLHWDTSLVAPIPFETGGILYLTDTAADQGALQVVPGFHRRLADGWLAEHGGPDPGWST